MNDASRGGPGGGSREAALAAENERLQAQLAELLHARAAEVHARDQARGLLQAVAEHAPVVIYAKDSEGRFILSNHLHASLLGRPTGEILGRREGELLDAEAAAEIEAHTAEVMRSGVATATELTIPLADGMHHFWESVFPLIDAEGRCYGLGGISTDVTDRRRMEEEQRRTGEALLKREKMAALGGLVAGVAHEINTPLGVALTAATHGQQVLGRLQEGVDRGDLTRAELRRALAEMGDACKLAVDNLRRGAHLITSFKMVAVDQTSEASRVVTLDEWLHDVVASLRPLLRAGGVEPRLRCPPGLRFEMAVGALTQVLTNLVQNACVHAFTAEMQDRRLEIAAEVDAGWLRIECADNGCGVRPEHVARVFEPFFTTRRGAGGSGLGMHVVHNIVTERFAGRIDLETSPAGTRLRIALPIGTPALRQVEGL